MHGGLRRPIDQPFQENGKSMTNKPTKKMKRTRDCNVSSYFLFLYMSGSSLTKSGFTQMWNERKFVEKSGESL